MQFRRTYRPRIGVGCPCQKSKCGGDLQGYSGGENQLKIKRYIIGLATGLFVLLVYKSTRPPERSSAPIKKEVPPKLEPPSQLFLGAPSARPPKPLPRLNKEASQFRAFTLELFDQLPRSNSQEQSAELASHRPPRQLFRLSEPLGKVEDELIKGEQHLQIGMRFLERCASSPEITIETRTVCTFKLRRTAKRFPQYQTVSEKVFSPEIERLLESFPEP